MAHNGEALPPAIVDDLFAANGGDPDPSWWVGDRRGHRGLPDSVVDWIEAVANGETEA